MKKIPNYYEVLKIELEATPSQIKQSFRELMLKHHPDKSQWDRMSSQEASQKII